MIPRLMYCVVAESETLYAWSYRRGITHNMVDKLVFHALVHDYLKFYMTVFFLLLFTPSEVIFLKVKITNTF